MDLARLHPVAFLLAWITVAAGLVEPPANVTLYCHNLTNKLMWDYNQLTPGLKFHVHIQPYDGDAQELWVEPPDLQADLSFLPSETAEFFLTVSAVMGENRSSPSPEDGIVLTYSTVSLVQHDCYLDLPPVNVTIQPHDQVHVSFEHPWLFYKPKRRNRKSHDAQISERLPNFSYEIMLMDQGKWSHHSSCKDSVCESKLPVHVAKKTHCLKINGELKRMHVKSKQEYCTSTLEETPFHYYIYIIVAVVVLIALAAIFSMVYRKKTRPTLSLPSAMTFGDKMINSTNRTMGPVQEQVDPCEPSSPTPLLPDLKEDEKEFPPARDYDLRLPIGVSPLDEGVPDDRETGEPNVEGSEYMQGNNLEDGSDTGYEKRPVFVNLAPDETAEGYRG
ncbi:interferon gamma receptor 1-like isoform X1 [Stegastes partitus]|uniref:Uncharacterized protein LOC103370705 n=2 Tax=Stegastes partitus TaxID=144197 RepID=A0A3B5A2L1_9TELE|nr:interferon gamma receptor 1-like precursor [Stegastes partitus]XP_008298058.1 PREDICTED: uncharacterized protein LOC103370705 [Stegastes partitus]